MLIAVCSYLEDVENTLFGPSFRDPAVGYSSVLDVSSFVTYFLLVELSKNPDGYRGSTFLHKVRCS
jgi:hypothetical protein